jgi:predicted SnoaL-like aldol condensation-catalyzing enzyme
VKYLRGEYPDLRLDIKRVIAEGEMVVTHSHLVLEDGKVVEHWDVIQEVPATAANTNGMF